MVALNADFAPSKTGADAKNRVGGFFSLAAEPVGVDESPSRNRIGENRPYAYETASVDTEFEYGPFGEPLRATGSKVDQFDFRFSTKPVDQETGLVAYELRYYNPETGRWLSRDPVGEIFGLNLYGFIDNDPTNSIDILGLARGRPVGNRFTPRNIAPNAINLQNAYQSAVRNYNANPNRSNRDRLQRIIRRATDASVRLGPQQRPGSAIRNNPFLSPAERQAALREGIQQPTLLTRPGNSMRDRLERQLAEAEIIRRELQNRCIDGVFNQGVNVTPRSTANEFSTIGRGNRTFVTEPSAVESIIGPFPSGNRMTITPQQARRLEAELGLRPNSIESRNIISIVDNIPSRRPASPITGNTLFQGGGSGLPGGGAELTIQGIPSAGGSGIRQIILEVQ